MTPDSLRQCNQIQRSQESFCRSKLISATMALGIHASFRMARTLLFAVLLFWLMSASDANENVTLKIIDFSSSEVQLSCHYDYNGNMAGVAFSVLKGSSVCLERSGGSSVSPNCGLHILESEDPKTLRFAVKLDRSCHQNMNLRCKISKTVAGSTVEYEDSIKLTAQSDPPIISVNEGQQVRARFEPIQITCNMTNSCDETKVDVFGEVPMQLVSTMSTQHGNRFNITATSLAMFSQPGNYTITCKEAGKEDIYSRSHYVIVLSSQKVSYLKNDTKDSESGEVFKDSENMEVFIVLFIVVSALAFVGCILVLICIRLNGRRKRKLPKIGFQEVNKVIEEMVDSEG